MILGQISYLDSTRGLPLSSRTVLPFIEGRWRNKRDQAPFVQHASPFQDFVIRCVRYAFANFPPNIGQVFFSKAVSLPFMRFRMLRHGHFTSPMKWTEVNENGIRGILIQPDKTAQPDVVIYYLHGGGFAMGSSYFYLEPLMVLVTLLKPHYKNPTLFALEYSLVPDARFPTQLTETVAGYEYALALVSGDTSRINVAGDSAGGTLALSLLLTLAQTQREESLTPAYATLLSPWVTLKTENNQDTQSDFLSVQALEKYGTLYAGNKENLFNPLVSPGCCVDLARWKKAAPTQGIYFTYGAEEAFCKDIRAFVRRLRKANVDVSVQEEPGAVHAWVIASLFLEDSLKERIMGMRELAKAVAANIPSVR